MTLSFPSSADDREKHIGEDVQALPLFDAIFTTKNPHGSLIRLQRWWN